MPTVTTGSHEETRADRSVWSLASLVAVLPKSASPVCSTASGSCPLARSTKSESYTPRNQTQNFWNASATAVHEWIEHAKKFGYPSNFDRNNLKLRQGPKRDTVCADQSYLLGINGGPNFNDDKKMLISRPKPYHEFLQEFEKKKLEAEKDASKKAKCLRLIHKVRRREAAVDHWESKEVAKAMEKLATIEKKLEKKRIRASERTWTKIYHTKEKAEQQKIKVRKLITDDYVFG